MDKILAAAVAIEEEFINTVMLDTNLNPDDMKAYVKKVASDLLTRKESNFVFPEEKVYEKTTSYSYPILPGSKMYYIKKVAEEGKIIETSVHSPVGQLLIDEAINDVCINNQ